MVVFGAHNQGGCLYVCVFSHLVHVMRVYETATNIDIDRYGTCLGVLGFFLLL